MLENISKACAEATEEESDDDDEPPCIVAGILVDFDNYIIDCIVLRGGCLVNISTTTVYL